MGGFRRLALFVFSLAGLACLAALALPWFGLASDITGELEASQAYILAVEVCLAMTSAWLVVNLVRSIVSRRNDAIEVMDIDGGAITVTKNAVASQAGHIVEALGVGVAKDVEVKAGASGPVRVTVRVTPYESIDVTSEAPVLHDGLVTGLSAMCGERLGAVSVEFLEPQRASSLVEPVDDASDEEPGEEPAEDPTQGAEPETESARTQGAVQASSAEVPGDITIHMGSERGEQA